jgi:hypothetical protein
MIEPTKRPLVIYDTSVICHRIIDLTTVDGKIRTQLTNKNRDERIKAGVALYNSLFWLESLNAEDVDIIWVGDDKSEKYWRINAVREWLDGLEENNPSLARWKSSRSGYKGNRFHEPYRTWCMKRMDKFSGCLTIPGYEADDIAAGIVKDIGGARPVLLATIDSDWIQMVDESVTWVCMHGYTPQLRDIRGGKAWFSKKLGKESSKAQSKLSEAGISLLDPDLRDIVKWKSIMGDKSDNLPPGTPSIFIDLFNPVKSRKVWEMNGFTESWQDQVKRGWYNEEIVDTWKENAGCFDLPTPSVWV